MPVHAAASDAGAGDAIEDVTDCGIVEMTDDGALAAEHGRADDVAAAGGDGGGVADGVAAGVAAVAAAGGSVERTLIYPLLYDALWGCLWGYLLVMLPLPWTVSDWHGKASGALHLAAHGFAEIAGTGKETKA